ncbi:MAG: hypothetical protein Q8P67_19605 [archaeon]|nr:hypothetical protein [archaeon]
MVRLPYRRLLSTAAPTSCPSPAEQQLRKSLGLPPVSQPLLRRGSVESSPLLTASDWASRVPVLSPSLPPSVPGESDSLGGVVVDTRELDSPSALSWLHASLQPLAASVGPSGRFLFLTDPSEGRQMYALLPHQKNLHLGLKSMVFD